MQACQRTSRTLTLGTHLCAFVHSFLQGPGSGRYAGMSAYDQDTIKGAPEEEEEDEFVETDTAEEMDDLVCGQSLSTKLMKIN